MTMYITRSKISVCSCVVLSLLVIIKFTNYVTFDDFGVFKFKKYPLSYKNEKPKPYDITVVTMYVQLGNFQKGGPHLIYTHTKYRAWMQTFGWLTNRLVVILTDDETYEYFKQIRYHHPPERTVFIRVNRSDLSAFKNYEKVNQIFSTANYPKHPPNTVNANYSVVCSAKYDALQMAMDLGHVKTDYIAWLDIGYFRNMLQANIRPKNDLFTLEAPLDFDPTKIAFTEVGEWKHLKNLSPWDYIKDNQVWLAAGLIFGHQHLVRKFIVSYKRVVQSLLKDNMSSTDQQVIGAMYSPQFIKDQQVGIQTYRCKDGQYGLYKSDVQYFCLGYICKEAAEIRKANAS